MNLNYQNLISLVLLLLHFSLYGQVVPIDYILASEIEKVRKVDTSQNNTVTFATDFGVFEIKDMLKLDSLNESQIEKIDLVYTQFVESETFVQPKLNRQRLEYLAKCRPYIFENNLIEWNIICQTGAKSSSEAKNYFHGFIVHYKDNNVDSEELTTEDEISVLKRCLSECRIGVGDTVLYPSDILKLGKLVLDTIILVDSIIKIPIGKFSGRFLKINPHDISRRSFFTNDVKKRTVYNSYSFSDTVVILTPYSKREKNKVEDAFRPRSKRKDRKGIIYEKKSIWGRKPVFVKSFVKDTVYLHTREFYVVKEADSTIFSRSCYRKIASRNFTDTIVGKTLSTFTNWETKIVVEDVTGSMYPYLTQTFLWRRLATDSTNLTKFVYFNDGDSKRDREKVIGSTGGIYDVDSPYIEVIESVGLKTMTLGNGGDGPENNIEALLYASQICSNCELLMIADNNAPIKDIVLMDRLDRPVDIILCGVRGGRIQANYLTLVREVGGDIYTMEGELKDITKLKEGDEIKFGDQKFRVVRGEFILSR